jgi:heterodisulfide reductase subunit A-like polyferredoxin
VISPKLVEVGRHLNIELLTNSELLSLDGEKGAFKARIRKNPRYVDPEKCTSCGECALVCPVEFPSDHNQGLNLRKATFKQYEQAIPWAFSVIKKDRSPCTNACPNSVNAHAYVALARQKKYKEALEVILRICPHPCEDACRRNQVDSAVSICTLKRFIADQVNIKDLPVPEIVPRPERVAIVGAGPAGLSAAAFLARKGVQVTMFEALSAAGGMLKVGIPDYRLPPRVLEDEVAYITGHLGVDIQYNRSLGRDFTVDSLFADGFASVYLALGCHRGMALGIPGESAEGGLSGVTLLKETALGRGKTLKGRVVVIGGGDVAIDAARTALRIGADRVSILYRRTEAEMPARDEEIEDALEEGIDIQFLIAPREVIVNDGKTVGLCCLRMALGEPDNSGRRRPVPVEGSEFVMDTDYIIPAIGQRTDTSCINEKEGITINRWGNIEVDPITFETRRTGVFAGGDAETGAAIAINAVAAGNEAGISILRFLDHQDLARGRGPVEYAQKNFNPIPDTIKKARRQTMERIPMEQRLSGFDEVEIGFTEDQAVAEANRCLDCMVCCECFECVKACEAGALTRETHLEQPVAQTLDVGAVIMAMGSRPFDPSTLDDIYMYKRSPNVMTSLEFERILSAGGPTMGHLVRPSDNKEPEKIAWLQCIGSRDTNRCNNGYCSSVCCMYAIKDAMIAKEHSQKNLDCAIFNMDMRTFGKDYEQYYSRAKDEAGVRFVRSRIHSVDEVRETGNLILNYADEKGAMVKEAFDMVILSVGLEIPIENQSVARRIGVDMDPYGFALTSPFNPLESSRPGVYVAGVFQGPKDIPSSVIEAGGAACAAGMALVDARNTRVRTVEQTEERDVAGQAPRIGVFVCKCGINIAGVVDVERVDAYARTLPGVVYSEMNLFTCSQDAQIGIKEKIDEYGLNRVVVASCTPKTHEGIFMDTLEKSGLNKYLFEMANIRNQDSWMHYDTPEKATKKAEDLVRMAVARVATLTPLHEKQIPVTQRALVIGGGIAGMTAAKALGDQGFETVLIERDKRLGGLGNRLVSTIEGADVRDYVTQLAQRVEAHERIQVLKESLVVGFTGYKGNFTTEVLVGPGMYERKINHGVVIVATGADEYTPVEYLYPETDRVTTQVELAQRLHDQGAKDLDHVIMIQCVGSRNDENPNCSRVCCQSAVKNAIAIKRLNPGATVFILYRDMRMYAMLEAFYTEARQLGVMFFRFDRNDPPVVEKSGSGLTVTFTDHVLDVKLSVETDLVALSAGVRAADTGELASLIKVGRDPQGFFMEAHVKLKPVDATTEGVFICGTAHGPKLISETIAQALAAASRAVTFLSRDYLTLSAVTAEVDPENCAACLICVRSCPYNVPVINAEGVSYIDPALCQGCGVCAAECPAKTIKLNWYEDEQLLSKVEALLEEVS